MSTETPKAGATTWIRIKDAIPLPSSVRDAIHRLNDAGFSAYVVGGSIRDFFLKRPTKDHDLATNAKFEEMEPLFENTIHVGKAFGVLKVPVPGTTEILEITTFREDLEYENHRHPKKVRFSSPQADAFRRDFTINAIYYDPKLNQIMDPTNGMEDLKQKVLRAIGNAPNRFEEDALRLLRAIRFSTSLDFTIEPKTDEAIKRRARLITKVSGERVRDELNFMLTGPKPAQAIQEMSRLGLLVHLIPELEKLKGIPQSPIYGKAGDVWGNTIDCLNKMVAQNKERSAVLAWSVLLHEIGKPVAARRSRGENFNNHEVDGAQMAAKICKRLKMSRLETESIVALISDYLKFSEVFHMRESTLQRWMRQPYFEDLLKLHRIDAAVSDGNMAAYEFCATAYEASQSAPGEIRLIDGEDLIKLGLDPGPRFSQILREIENLAIEKRLASKEEALEFVVKHYI